MAAGELSNLPLLIDDDPTLTPMKLRSRCRRILSDEGDLRLVVVDYLQLMKGDRAYDRDEREVAEISRSLKLVAKELDCPVIALSQLNRRVESRPKNERRPVMSDLRDSGALEQDADVIAFLYRDVIYNRKTDNERLAEVIIGKQRSGPTGTVYCAFFGEYTRFENLAEEDVPADELPDEAFDDSPGTDWHKRAAEAREAEGW